MSKKIRVAVLYGGKSGEHEVSLQSATSVIRHLSRERFDLIPVAIDKDGRWRWDRSGLNLGAGETLTIVGAAAEVRLSAQSDGRVALVPLDGAQGVEDIDLVFPVMHGPLYEDGALQGLLELTGAAYVGSGVLASAVSMDKDVAKRLIAFAGLPVVPSITIWKQTHDRDPSQGLLSARETLTLPVFVKPCNMGSSVGVHKVKNWGDLVAALDDAFLYDTKVLIEQGIDAREIEVAILEDEPLLVSVPSEINAHPKHEFYSYEAKYLDQEGGLVDLPAKLDPSQTEQVRAYAAKAFATLECSGLARIDFFLDRQSGDFYFNEINTLPGFTSISMYPKMMEAAGLPYERLLSRLIEVALERHVAKLALRRER